MKIDATYVKALTRSTGFLVSAAAALSAAAGAAAGYQYAVKKLSAEYDERANREIEEARARYQNLQKDKTPQELLAELHADPEARAAMESYSAESETPEGVKVIEKAELRSISIDKEVGPGGGHIESVEPAETNNIFDNPPADPGMPLDNGWNYQTELKLREENPDVPFVISDEEYNENETEYTQASLVYYEGDQTLVDDQAVIIPDADGLVGDDNLVKFGHGTRDENLLYVRNEEREMDFEIIREPGSYSVLVLGFEEEPNQKALRHSHRPRSQRWDDS